MAVEIILIVIGVIFLIGSCFFQEKLSGKDVDQISKLSEEEIKIILDKKINGAKVQIEEAIELTVEDSKELAKREMERESNEKIMAINEYSDTVLESINKTHNEIMFLYSMLNDKQKDITELVTTIQSLSKKMKLDPETGKKNTSPLNHGAMPAVSTARVQPAPTIEMTRPQLKAPRYSVSSSNSEQMLDNAMRQISLGTSEVNLNQNEIKLHQSEREEKKEREQVTGNQNIKILQLHRAGKSDVAIAKELNCGLGEVRLVLGLYKGENNSEN